MIRLLALDIDGTLLRSDKTISSRTLEAIARARALRRAPRARHGAPLPLGATGGGGARRGRFRSCCTTARWSWRTARCCAAARWRAAAARTAIAVGRAAGAEPVLHCGANGEGRLLVDADARRSGLVGYYLERSGGEVQVRRPLESVLDAEEPDPGDVRRHARGDGRAARAAVGAARRPARGSSARSTRRPTWCCST